MTAPEKSGRPILRLPEDRPVATAAYAALLYVAIALAYILLSGRIAARWADSVERLQAIETAKGIGFVVVTGLLFFFISLGWWRTRRRQRNLLVQSERRMVAALYGASLAHDLNNMLMGLQGLVEGLRNHTGTDPFLATMQGGVERAIQSLAPMSKRLAAMSRDLPAGQPRPVEIPAALARITELARKHPDVRFCTFRTVEGPSATVEIQLELLEQAVLNLLVNAAQAAGTSGRIELRAGRQGDDMVIEVHDSGPGIPPEQRDAIFGAGYTTKCDGSGLGLLSVQAFAASCGARISVDSSPLGGCCFRLGISLSMTAPTTTSVAPGTGF